MESRIDVYVDINNSNNAWGLITHKEKGKIGFKTEQEFVRFYDYPSMINYVNSYFKGHFSFHSIDYSMIEYHFYKGNPNLNYVEIKYYEYNNGKREPKKLKMPEEFKNTFIDILKINKKIPEDVKLDSRYHRDIDVYEEEKTNRKEIARSIKMTLEEFFSIAGEKIRNIGSRKIVKGISLLASVALLGNVIGHGYKLVMDNIYNSDFLTQENPIRSVRDIKLFFNKGNIGQIIEKLIKEDYSEINIDDVKDTMEYLKNLENSNYDQNDSHNYFNFSDYFDYKVDLDVKDYGTSSHVLNTIEKLYNKCFDYESGKPIINNNSAKEYIDYVASLTFMYDTYHDTRPSLVSLDTQIAYTSYAKSDEILVFDSYPPILRYIILNQLKGVLSRSNYEVKERPSYYFKDLDKYSLLEELNKKIEETRDELYTMSLQNKENKQI